jgi:hypothetical protein
MRIAGLRSFLMHKSAFCGILCHESPARLRSGEVWPRRLGGTSTDTGYHRGAPAASQGTFLISGFCLRPGWALLFADFGWFLRADTHPSKFGIYRREAWLELNR